MWTNGHCLNAVGENINSHHADNPYCRGCKELNGVEEVEDQLHLFVRCGQVEEQRTELLDALEKTQPGFRQAYTQMDDEERLRALMFEAPEGTLMKKEATKAATQSSIAAVCRFLNGALDAHPDRRRWRRHFTK